MKPSFRKNAEQNEPQPPWRVTHWTIIGSLILAALVGFLAAEFQTWGRHNLVGPATMRFTVIVKVSDNLPFHIGSDFYADVDILDGQGKTLVQWEDPTGQDSYGAIERLVASMTWRDESTLTFDSESGRVVIHRKKVGVWHVDDRL